MRTITPKIKKRWYQLYNFSIQCRIGCHEHASHLARTWRPVEPFKYHGWHWPSNPRVPLNLMLLWLVLTGLVGTPLYIQAQQLARYHLTPAADQLTGDTSQDLTNKLGYDQENDQFTFNYEQLTQSQNEDQQGFKTRVGGADQQETNLYSADLSRRLSGGMSVHDANYDLSFDLVPQFSGDQGKRRGQHIVYPLDDGGQLVYTPKSNGFKEDIIHSQPPENGETSYTYELNLPPTLDARELDTGGIGIFSASPALYGDISFGSDADQTRVKEARVNADKDHLVFVLPAPVVKTTDNRQQAAGSTEQESAASMRTKEVGSAEFRLEQLESNDELSGTEPASDNGQKTINNEQETTTNALRANAQDGQSVVSNTDQDLPPQVAATQRAQQKSQHYTLTLEATGLSGVSGPISIDPSVVVSSSSEFGDGNDEYGIDFGSGEISRQGLGGGELQSWSTTSSLNTARFDHASVVYDGYVYVIGGWNGSTYYNSVEYAPINSGGNLGSWSTTSSINTAKASPAAAVYNGHIYTSGGVDSGSYVATTEYAPINSDGTLGSWQTTSSLNTGKGGHTSVVSNGHVYAIGGYSSGGTYYTTVEYAPVHADGTLGSWQTTSGLNTARGDHASVFHNGYIYVTGGFDGSSLSSVEYVSVSDDGTLGSWQTTTALSAVRDGHGSVVSGGYLYVIGGYVSNSESASAEYASVHADGTIGSWEASSTMSGAHAYTTAVAHDGYVYAAGGDNSGALSSVEYAQIQPDGYTTDYSTTTQLPEYDYNCGVLTCSQSRGLTAHGSVAYNGHVYIVGGYRASGNSVTNVYHASINSDGTLGSWTSTNGLNTGRMGHGVKAYGGYIYAIAGHDINSGTDLSSVEYASINSDGTLGSWSTTSSLNTARQTPATAIHNQYVYAISGYNSGNLSSVEYAPINSNGTLGSWSTTSSLNNARQLASSAVVSDYIYTIGGGNSSTNMDSVEYASINNDGTLSSWQTTSNLNAGRGGLQSVVRNGHIYAIGGSTSDTTDVVADVEFASVNDDGTVSAWRTTNSLGNARFRHGVAISKTGHIYATGGDNDGSFITTSEYARINNGGPGTVDGWSSASSLNTGRYSNGTAVHDDHVYTVGGYDGSNTLSSVEYAPINDDGTLGSWQTTSGLNTSRYAHSVVVSNGYIYAIAGHDGSNVLSSVEYAPINDGGTLGSWQTTSSATRFAHSSVAYNDHVYIIGGSTGSGDLTDVDYASVNSDGSLSSWQSTSGMNAPRSYGAATTIDGYMYALGGESDSNLVSSVEYAPINTDGTLGLWEVTSSLNEAKDTLRAAVSNGYMYVAGGVDSGGTVLDTVEYASVHKGGGVGKWHTTTSLTDFRQAPGLFTHDGHLYAVAGYTGSYSTSVEYASLNSIPHKGRYSKLIDFGAESSFDSVSYSGSPLGGKGLDVSYKSACEGVFDATATTLHDIQPGETRAVDDTTRYVLATFHLDDRQSAAFPDDNTSALTDFTLDYSTLTARPTPEQRLRAGNYFDNQEEQPYDTLAEEEEGQKSGCTPSVTTASVTNVTVDSADTGGTVTGDGGQSVSERGVVYAASQNPDVNDTKVTSGSGTGSFSTPLTGLNTDTTYYVRAYAINSLGTAYGQQRQFTTDETGYAVGDTGPAGGVVFYDKGSYSSGWRYLESSTSDQSTGTNWGCYGTAIPAARSTLIGYGEQNTAEILDGCSDSGIAARVADNYSSGGYGDWFLPSQNELDEMYDHRSAIGGFASDYYFSSSEDSDTNAFRQNFSDGSQSSVNKSNNNRVRAVRAF